MSGYFPMNTTQCDTVVTPVAVHVLSQGKMPALKREGLHVRARTCLTPTSLATTVASPCTCLIPPHKKQVSCGESAKECCGVTEQCRLGTREIVHSWRVILGEEWSNKAVHSWLILCWLGIGYWDILKKKKRKEGKLAWESSVPVCSLKVIHLSLS